MVPEGCCPPVLRDALLLKTVDRLEDPLGALPCWPPGWKEHAEIAGSVRAGPRHQSWLRSCLPAPARACLGGAGSRSSWELSLPKRRAGSWSSQSPGASWIDSPGAHWIAPTSPGKAPVHLHCQPAVGGAPSYVESCRLSVHAPPARSNARRCLAWMCQPLPLAFGREGCCQTWSFGSSMARRSSSPRLV